MNNTEYTIHIREELEKKFDKPMAQTPEEGDIIFDQANSLLQSNNVEKLVMDFEGLQAFTSAFLNIAIGKLFLNNNHEDLFHKLTITGLSTSDDLQLIGEAIKLAIVFSEQNSSN